MNLSVVKIYGSSLLDEIKTYVRTNSSNDIGLHLFKLVFLCGKKISDDCNRRKIREFLSIHRPDVKCINVEDIMNKFLGEMDLFTLEEFIAALCDLIILFPESPGSICELGAFASRDNLVKKMLVINDRSFINSQSFITQGPIARIKRYNENSVLYTDNNAIFLNPDLHNSLVNCVPKIKDCKPNNKQDSISIDAYIYEIIDIINLFSPVTSKQISSLYKYLKGFESYSFFDQSIDGASLARMIKPKHILDFLELLGYIERIARESDYYILSSTSKKAVGFLFSFNEKKYQLLRTHIVSRKYKYKDWYGNESCYQNVRRFNVVG